MRSREMPENQPEEIENKENLRTGLWSERMEKIEKKNCTNGSGSEKLQVVDIQECHKTNGDRLKL